MTDATLGRPPPQVARCRPGLPTVASLMCSCRALWIASRPKKAKEQVRLDPLCAGAVGHDQAGIAALERALGEDDGNLLDLGGHLTALLSGCGSDAAAGLRDAGDLRRDLGRALREELVKLLDRHARGLAQHPHGGAGAFGLVLVPHELDDLPVPVGELRISLLPADLGCH